MIFIVSLKDPDAFWDIGGMTEGEIEEAQEIGKLWIAGGEYVDLEIDTEKKTCTVLKANRVL